MKNCTGCSQKKRLQSVHSPWSPTSWMQSQGLMQAYGVAQIIPQAICSQHGLAVGAAMAPAVRVLVVIFFPITYPISKAWLLRPGRLFFVEGFPGFMFISSIISVLNIFYFILFLAVHWNHCIFSIYYLYTDAVLLLFGSIVTMCICVISIFQLFPHSIPRHLLKECHVVARWGLTESLSSTILCCLI